MNSAAAFSTSTLVAAWRALCDTAPSSVRRTAEGVEFIFSGLPIGFFNAAIVTSPSASDSDLRRIGVEACRFAASHPVPWMLFITTDTLEAGTDADAALDACGMAPALTLIGMQTDSPLTSARLVPAELQLTVPTSDEACRAVMNINSAAYGMDFSSGQVLMGRREFWEGHFPVVGLVDGRPVSTASVLMAEGVRYVSCVATHPDYQRRGYGNAATRYALELSARAHPKTPAVLHATEAGAPVYTRLGFEAIAKHPVYMEKRFLEQH